MACLDQRQFRNPTTNDTTTLGNLESKECQSLGLNQQQNATIERMILALELSDTFNNVNGQNGAALQATSKLYQLLSPGLPDNQWQLELQGWFEISLAKLQRYVLDFVDNPWAQDTTTNKYISVVPPSAWPESDSDALQAQCSQQLIRGIAAFQTFSVLGIAIIVVVSITLIIPSWTLSKCVRKSSQGAGYRTHANIAHGKLNLLRMALEGRGYTGWTNADEDIPIRPEQGANIHPPRLVNGGVKIPYADDGHEEDNHKESQEVQDGVELIQISERPPVNS